MVETVKTTGLDDPGRGTIYYDFGRDSYSSIFLHLRAQNAPLEAVPAVRSLLREYDPGVPVADAHGGRRGRRIGGGPPHDGSTRDVLYEVRPTDPVVFGSVGLLTLGLALVATAIPARRAAATDPAGALRSE